MQARQSLQEVGALALRGGNFYNTPPRDPGLEGSGCQEEEEKTEEAQKRLLPLLPDNGRVLHCSLEREWTSEQGAILKEKDERAGRVFLWSG